jgi:hypothetical protein
MVGAGHPKAVTEALETARNLSSPHGDAVLHKMLAGASLGLSSYSAKALIRGMKNNGTRYEAARLYVLLNATDLSVREVKDLAREIEPEISASLRANMNTVKQQQTYESNAHMAGYVLGDTPGRRVARALEAQNRLDLQTAELTAAQRRDGVLELYAGRQVRPMSAKDISKLALEAETPGGRAALKALAVKAQK